jgi:uncharacterized protein YdaU (DUF1376 family)
MTDRDTMPLNHADFWVDCAVHLNFEQTGVYIRLLALCWQRGGSFPEKEICEVMRIDQNKWEDDIAPSLARFFVVTKYGWFPVGGHINGDIFPEIELYDMSATPPEEWVRA